MKVNLENPELYTDAEFSQLSFPTTHDEHHDLGISTLGLFSNAQNGLTFAREDSSGNLSRFELSSAGRADFVFLSGIFGKKFSPDFIDAKSPIHGVHASLNGLANPKAYTPRSATVLQLCVNRTEESPVRNFRGEVISKKNYEEYSDELERVYQWPKINDLRPELLVSIGKRKYKVPIPEKMANLIIKIQRKINKASELPKE